ncbi:PDZ domain-containing protein [Halocola ammonii]
MITRSFFPAVGLIIGMLLCSASVFSQSKAKISIIKNRNGEVETITREIEIKEGQDLESVLAETDIWQEFSNVEDGETYEINIVKIKGGEEIQQMNLFLGDDFEMPQKKPFLGVMLKEVKSEPGKGVMISKIIENTAAEKSDLRAGDIILEIDGEEVNTIEDVTEAIGSKEPGDKIRIKYERDGKTSKEKIDLGEKPMEFFSKRFHSGEPGKPPHPPRAFHFEMPEIPEAPEIPEIHIFTPDSAEAPEFWKEKDLPFLGITPGQKREKGVTVGTVISESAAEAMGLQSGDVILSFNDNEVNDFDLLADLIGETKPQENVTLEIEREGQTMNLEGAMGKRAFAKAKNYRMHRDFLGRDEDGAYSYEFQFDSDTMNMEELRFEIQKQMEEYNREMQNFEREMEQLDREMEELDREMERVEVEMTIEVMKITDEDVEKVNANSGDKKLFKESTLELESIELFPNPTDGRLRLAFQTSKSGENLEVLVFSQNGKIVFRELVPEFDGSYENVIDISEQANGNYFLQVMMGDEVYSRKLMKQ